MKPSDKYGQTKPHITGAALKQIQEAGRALAEQKVEHKKELANPAIPTPTPCQKYGGNNDSTPPPSRGRSLS